MSLTIQSPDHRREIILPRWPLIIAGIGWLILAVASLVSSVPSPPYLMPTVWAVGSITALAATIDLLVRPSSDALVRLLAITTVVGVARSLAYIAAGAWSPFGVWLIVVGLTVGHVTRHRPDHVSSAK